MVPCIATASKLELMKVESAPAYATNTFMVLALAGYPCSQLYTAGGLLWLNISQPEAGRVVMSLNDSVNACALTPETERAKSKVTNVIRVIFFMVQLF